MSLLTNLLARHPLGTVVDTDNYPRGGIFQCVDPVREVLHIDLGLPYRAWGNAREYGQHTPADILTVLDRIYTTDVVEGDIVPLAPIDSDPRHADGHIGIATGQQTPTQLEIVEQNGHTGSGKGIDPDDKLRKRWIPKSRVICVLRLRSKPATIEAMVAAGQTWNIRDQPNVFGKVVGTVRRGDVLTVIGITANNWRQTSRGYITGDAFTSDETTEKVLGAGSYVIRTQPSLTAAKTGQTVTSGESFATTKVNGEWRKLTKNGVTGYVGPAAWR